MKTRTLLTLGLLASAIALPALPASAQMMDRAHTMNRGQAMNGPMMGEPAYRQWQSSWDRGQFDRRHVILGTVTRFDPYRLQIARPNGTVQTIDLKHGTAILPQGETPSTNQRVAIVGYYSQGTFIANRVILRD